MNLPKSVTTPLGNEFSKPVVRKQRLSLSDMYKLYADNTEDGQEGPLVWANATHQWNKIPIYEMYVHAQVWAAGETDLTLAGSVTLDVEYECELTSLAAFKVTNVQMDQHDKFQMVQDSKIGALLAKPLHYKL